MIKKKKRILIQLQQHNQHKGAGQIKMKEVANEDEVATELSRESSIIYATSTPTRQIRNESDKQILEWAAKLELESIELREKSLTLVGKLNDRYVEFKKVIQNFDTVEKSLCLN